MRRDTSIGAWLFEYLPPRRGQPRLSLLDIGFYAALKTMAKGRDRIEISNRVLMQQLRISPNRLILSRDRLKKVSALGWFPGARRIDPQTFVFRGRRPGFPAGRKVGSPKQSSS